MPVLPTTPTTLALGYATTTAFLLTGLLLRRASLVTTLATPLLALPTFFAATILASLTIAATNSVRLAIPHAALLIPTATCALAGLLAGLYRPRDREPTVSRGTRILPARTTRARRGQLTLAGLPVPLHDETKHFKLIGTTGTGKSTAIRELMSAALERGDRAVFADPDGGYRREFERAARGDVVVNPFDAHAHRWDLFAEIDTPWDVDQLARALIPDHEGADKSWRQYARVFFTAVTRQAHLAGVTSVAELYRLLTAAPSDELQLLVAGTSAQPFLEDTNARMFSSIRSVTGAAVSALEYVAGQEGRPVSIRRWVREGSGVLYLPYQATQIAALRSLISAQMRLAIFETMSRTGEGTPLWFVVDELDALGEIDGLKDALARLRKFGGRCVLGFQSIAQVSSTYGPGEAQTIVENCGSTLILRCSASEQGGTAEFASRLIGQREVIRPHVSRSRSGGFIHEPRSTVSRSLQHVTEPAVLASEIEQLPDLAGYLKFASTPDWRHARLVRPSAR